jgi:chromosomal replication initiation ATPase DnaA
LLWGPLQSAYIDFVSQDEPEEIEKFYSLKNLPSMLGSDLFKEFIREKFSDLTNQPEIPESKALAPDIEKVITVVCNFYGVSRAELFESRRGTENLPRDAAIYLVRRLCRMTLPSVGRVFGVGNYSSVSSVVQRVKSRIGSEKRLLKELEGIAQQVAKGQKRT